MDLSAPHGPAWVFLGVVVVIAVFPWLAERVRVPGIIGLLLGGLLLGQNGLGVVPEGDLVIPAIGQIGLLYLMFLAGVELDLTVLQRYRRTAVAFALLTFVAPLVLGFAAATLLGYGTAASLLVGSLVASHTLVTYPTVRALGLGSNGAVATAVGATVLTDTLALLVLAGVAGSATGEASGGELALQMGVGLAVLAVWCFVVLPRLGHAFFRGIGQERTLRFVFLLAALLSAAVVAEVFEIEGLVGAFFAGLGLNRLVPNRSPLMERTEFFGSALLVPLFLISVGLLIDPAVVVDPRTLAVAGALTVACLGGKALAAALTRPLFRFSWAEAGTVFSLTTPQAAATLAATVVGFELGLLSETVVNAVLVLIVVSLLVASAAAELAGRRVAPAAASVEQLDAPSCWRSATPGWTPRPRTWPPGSPAPTAASSCPPASRSAAPRRLGPRRHHRRRTGPVVGGRGRRRLGRAGRERDRHRAVPPRRPLGGPGPRPRRPERGRLAARPHRRTEPHPARRGARRRARARARGLRRAPRERAGRAARRRPAARRGGRPARPLRRRGHPARARRGRRQRHVAGPRRGGPGRPRAPPGSRLPAGGGRARHVGARRVAGGRGADDDRPRRGRPQRGAGDQRSLSTPDARTPGPSAGPASGGGDGGI